MKKIGILTALTAGLLGTSPLPGQELLWSDEFDTGSQPNEDVWSYDLGTGANGWGNMELQTYTNNPNNIKISNGNLVITARQTLSGEAVTGFTSARIRSQDKFMFRYGTIEARIKVPDLGRGLWPAFWTLGNDFPEVGWPACGELDVMEMGSADAIIAGKVNRIVGSTAHYEDNGHKSYGLSLEADENLDDDFHIFRMDWTPNLITTYLDGEKIWEIDITVPYLSSEFHKPHFVILNMAVGGTYPSKLSIGDIDAAFPAELLVDYVRVYDNGFTEVDGTALGTPDIGPAHSGSWYNEDQSGHGFSMEFVELDDGTRLAIVYWYTFDSEGNPIFLVGVGTPDGNRVEVTFESAAGMKYGVFDPLSVSREDGGSAVFEFIDRDNATFSYTPSDYTMMQWGHMTSIEELPLVKIVGIDAELKFRSASE